MLLGCSTCLERYYSS